MRILYLRTSSMQCDPHVASIVEYCSDKGLFLRVFDYFVSNPELMILNEFDTYHPTHVVWLGVCGGPYQPSSQVFRAIREKAKVIALVPEASHPDWAVLLKDYEDAFDLVVNLDGNSDWDPRGLGLTTLAIYGREAYDCDQLLFPERPIDVGFCGGSGAPGTMRDRLVRHLSMVRRHHNSPLLTMFPFIEVLGTYDLYAQFMMKSKIIVNAAGSSGDRSKHVKGRVLEAGLAGCVLIEEEGSPIDKWFPPDSYYTFSDPQDCEYKIYDILNSPDEAQARASKLASVVYEKYSPSKLWSEILKKTNGQG